MNPDSTNENEKDTSGNASSISSDLIRGHINTIILRTLYDGDKYGYEIINEIEEKSKGQYTLKQPTLYSALKRLESQDYLTSYWGGVSNGGRRKYFQITDKGRQVVEQNLAEWEYSRTVIDSLISERDYDFNNPPPASSVDFNILKKSTTRVHGGKADDDEDFSDYEEEDEESFADEENTPDEDSHQTESAQDTVADTTEVSSINNNIQAETPREETQAKVSESPAASAVETGSSQIYSEPSAAEPAATRPVSESNAARKEEIPLSEEEKQRIHKNYQDLIGDDTDATSYYYTHVAQRNREERSTFDRTVFGNAPHADMQQPPMQSQAYDPAQQAPYAPQPEYYYAPEEQYAAQPVDDRYNVQQPNDQAAQPRQEQNTADLLYANKSPAERNYKSLLSRLYDNTVKTHEEEATYADTQEQTEATQEAPEMSAQEPQPAASAAFTSDDRPKETIHAGNTASNIEFYDVEEKAENDGLRITTTNGARNRSVTKSASNTFDKGKTLFVTAVYVFIIALAESIINICLRDVMQTHTAYVVIPFVIDFVMLGIFLFLYLRGYGKNSRKTQTKSYISASLIVYVNLVLITCLVAYLISAATEASLNFMLYAIFPCVYIFNIPLFAILYNYHCNKS